MLETMKFWGNIQREDPITNCLYGKCLLVIRLLKLLILSSNNSNKGLWLQLFSKLKYPPQLLLTVMVLPSHTRESKLDLFILL